MPRILREDRPDTWHHVFNRAIARRTMFERREDYRYFLANLARAVRRREIEVHAYCLMGTHYHLLIRSPLGRMAGAMQRVQLAYSRWFNRSRRRDGSLVRGRYGSRPVRSMRYRRLLVRYIDFNPCAARVVRHASQYPWGSACHYFGSAGPQWLQREWVESEVALETGSGFRPEYYDRAFPPRGGDELSQFVGARVGYGDGDDILDDVFEACDLSIRDWMVRKAILADGTRPGLPLVPLDRLERLLEERKATPWIVRRGRSEQNGTLVAHAGLGRDLCGATLTRLATNQGISLTKIRRLYDLHRAEVLDETPYAAEVLQLAHLAIDEWKTL